MLNRDDVIATFNAIKDECGLKSSNGNDMNIALELTKMVFTQFPGDVMLQLLKKDQPSE